MSFDLDRFRKKADELDREARQAKANAQAAMIKLMPRRIADPETLAAATYEAFRLGLLSSLCSVGRKIEVEAILRDFGIVADAVHQYHEALSTLSQFGIYYLEVAANERRLDLDKLHEQLSVLAEICEIPKFARKKKKDHNTVAALSAAQCLIDHGITRQRAAKMVEAMMPHVRDVEPKTWGTIQDAMIEIGMKPEKLVKGSRKKFISLTPGPR